MGWSYLEPLAIETVTPYSGSYDRGVDQGRQRGCRPPIRPLTADPSKYDIIAVGTPTWWYTMAPAVQTFLDGVDWTGKTVIPFQTHGGWPGHVMKDIKKPCKGANFAHELAVQFDSTGGDRLETSEEEIQAWAKAVTEELCGD